MRFAHWTSAVLLGTGLVHASFLPKRYQQRPHEERDVAVVASVDTAVDVYLSDFATLEKLAEELFVDFQCLLAANPLLSTLHPGDHCTVPFSCCGHSCRGKFCSKRKQCDGQSTSSAPAQTTGTTTTCISTITTSIPTTLSALSTVSSGTANVVPSGSKIIPSGSTNVVPSGKASTVPSGSTSIVPSGSSIVSSGSSIVSTGSASVILSGSSVIAPGSNTVPGLVTTTNSLGQTLISDGSGANTISTGITTADTVTLPDGSVITFQPTTSPTSAPGILSGEVTTTNSLGETLISDSSGVVTIPTGLSTATTVTLPDGSIITLQSTVSSSAAVGITTTTDAAGETVISDSSGAVTIPTGITTSEVVTLPDGSIVTFQPTTQPATSLGAVGIVTTTDAAGETVISDRSGALTLPTGISTSSLVTLPDGSVITFQPSSPSKSSSGAPGIITTTDSAGETVLSDSAGAVTIPTGITTADVVTLPDGSVITFNPITPTTSPPSGSTSAASSTIPIGGIFPVTTSVPAPKATDGGTEIPCNLWFFDLCIQFGDITVGGWEFNLPPGIRPPGPPPAITFPPALSISVSISGTLPDWPPLTIGPDGLPTYKPKPSDGPDDGCETKSAEVCLTSTSFGVNTATVTTTSSVLSTCATVFGCDVSDSASSTATTSSASDTYSWYCTAGCTGCGVARRALPTATAAPSLPTPSSDKPRDLFAFHRELELNKRDIPKLNPVDGIHDFYIGVQRSPNTNLVPLDDPPVNSIPVGISSSRFRYFDASEFNIMVRDLAGCTSIVVVSRLGAYVSHLWEGPAFLGTDAEFTTDVLNYLVSGRPGGEDGTQPLLDLVQAGVFGDVATTRIFIMTPASRSQDLDDKTPGRVRAASLTNGNQQPQYDGSFPPSVDRLNPIRTELGQYMPGVPIAEFVYSRATQGALSLLDSGAYGAAMILYSNNQVNDPTTGNPLPAPQKATWQCWMQGTLMGSDLWDALPGQTGTCRAPAGNRKRQAGSLCSISPTASTSPASSTLSTVSTTSSVASTSSFVPLSNLPTLSTGISTPAGETCVSIATSTQCQLGPNPSETACATNTYCASFASTATTSSAAAATPTEYATIEIYSDSGCSDRVEQINLFLNQCYEPTNSFKCFQVGLVSSVAQTTAEIVAFKGEGCFAQSSSDYEVYSNLRDAGGTEHHDFTMGSLTLADLGSF